MPGGSAGLGLHFWSRYKIRANRPIYMGSHSHVARRELAAGTKIIPRYSDGICICSVELNCTQKALVLRNPTRRGRRRKMRRTPSATATRRAATPTGAARR